MKQLNNLPYIITLDKNKSFLFLFIPWNEIEEIPKLI